MTESEILNLARKLSGPAQVQFLKDACGSNGELHKRVAELLQLHDELDATLDSRTAQELDSQQVVQQVSQSNSSDFSWDFTQTIDSKIAQPSHRNSTRELQADSKVGPFKLLQILGKGGMGEVWMAEQLEPVKRRAALKVIKAGIGSKEILGRFEAERQALALMNHENIARILDAGTTPDGQPYFAMELVQGRPLTTYCDENFLSIDERLKLFTDVCSGVQHAHQKGIIHRDLKPGNILVAITDGKAVAKVIDFGLAKAMESSQRLTEQSMFTGIGQILGTLKYMSPEQASLDCVDIDTRTDIYALGVILYELLTGTTPLDDTSIKGEAALRILEFIREKEPVKPSSKLGNSADEIVSAITGHRKTDSTKLNRALAGDLDWIVMKALEKDRARRYESASDFAADVQRYLNSEPIVARPPTFTYRAQKFISKNRLAVSFAFVLAIALTSGIIGTSVAMVSARRSERIAEERRFQAEDALQRESDALAIAENHRRLAERREADANSAAKRAIAMRDIFLSGFNSKDIESNKFVVMTARDVLSSVRSFLVSNPKILADDPQVKGEILLTLSKSFASIGDHELSLECCEQLEQMSDLLGETKLVRHSNILRAEQLRLLERSAEAKSFLTQLTSDWNSRYDQNDEESLLVRYELGKLEERLGNYESAVELLEDVYSQQRAIYKPDDPRLIDTATALCSALHHAKKLDRLKIIEADVLADIQLHRQPFELQSLEFRRGKAVRSLNDGDVKSALDELLAIRDLGTREEAGGQNLLMLNQVDLALSIAYLRMDDIENELASRQRVLANSIKLYGPKSFRTLNATSSVLQCKGRLDPGFDSVQELVKLLQLCESEYGTHHAVSDRVRHELCRSLEHVGRHGEAAKYGEINLAEKRLRCETEKDWNDLARFGLYSLGTWHMKAGNHVRALELFEEAEIIQRRNLPPDDEAFLDTIWNLAQTLDSAERFEEAVTKFEEYEQIRKSKWGALHSDHIFALDTLLRTATKTNNDRLQRVLPKVVELDEALRAADEKTVQDNWVRVANCLSTASESLIRFSNYDDAEQMVKLCLDWREKFGNAGWTVSYSKLALAEILSTQGDNASASELFSSHYDELENRLKSQTPVLDYIYWMIEPSAWYARHLQRVGDATKAEEKNLKSQTFMLRWRLLNVSSRIEHALSVKDLAWTEKIIDEFKKEARTVSRDATQYRNIDHLIQISHSALAIRLLSGGDLASSQKALDQEIQNIRKSLVELQKTKPTQDEVAWVYDIARTILPPYLLLGKQNSGVTLIGELFQCVGENCLEEHRQIYVDWMNGFAWELSTSPHPTSRHGRLAVVVAKQAVNFAKESQLAACLDTLGASYAEAGDFDEAVRTMMLAIEKDIENQFRSEFESRIELFKRKLTFQAQ